MDREIHVFLARWSADCAGRVLHYFTRCSNDSRPKDALTIGRKWADGEIKTGVAMKASAAAHAAARQVTDKAAIAAARAAGQAVATAHFADHSIGALIYSMKALETFGITPDAEFEFQIAKLPEHLQDPIASGVSIRVHRFVIRGIKQTEQDAAANP